MTASVSVGTEWINTFRGDNSPPCRPPPPDLIFAGHMAGAFLSVMLSLGHTGAFNWGNDDAWSSDFDHPDFGGDSLDWSDNVHLCYVCTHGGASVHQGKRTGLALAFSSNRAQPKFYNSPCTSLSIQWRLGAKKLKWFVIDSCDIVDDTDPGHIWELWSGPMRGVHLLFGFIGNATISEDTYSRRAAFASEICGGGGMANAWVDTAFGWEQGATHASSAIAIAAGASRDEAISRREGETLDWVNFPVAATDWLAWKWRG
jgi:hypothetical protein